MKRTPKPVFFIVTLLILVLAYTSIFGVYTKYGDRTDTIIRGVDGLRYGIDISGGVEATFAPKDADVKATDEQISAMKEVIVRRMIARNITDYEAYTDFDNDQVIVRFPWKDGDSSKDPKSAVKELGQTALLEFYKDTSSSSAKPAKDKLVISGNQIASAEPAINQQTGEVFIALELNDSGKKAFSDATKEQYGLNNNGKNNTYTISIWLDDECISNPSVSAHIPDGQATITGSFTAAEAREISNLINSGTLPFDITDTNIRVVSATLGSSSLQVMVIAGIIAFVLISIFMLVYYRLPGFVAVICLLGQVAGSIAAVSSYFGFLNSFTLTLPGIAGIILSIGMGVDANIITAERIKEQIRMGKTIDSAIANGCRESFAAIFDGNITVIIVSIVLMGVFGPPDSMFAMLLKPILSFFPVSTSGAVYAFGYTLLIGIIFNFIMGVTCSRLMLKSVSRFKFLRKPWLLGGKRA